MARTNAWDMTAEHVFVQGINSTSFENQSTTVKITSKPWKRGGLVMTGFQVGVEGLLGPH